MAEEENVIEVEKVKKRPINIWKVALISLVSISIFTASGINIYNSSWYINQTLHIKKANDIQLGKNVTWSYQNKYEGNQLKIKLKLKNIDEKMMKVFDKFLDSKDDLVQLVFLDKDGFKVAELKVLKEDFVHITNEEGVYTAQTSLIIDKNTVRKIRDIDPKYRELLDKKYDDLMKEYCKKYGRLAESILGF